MSASELIEFCRDWLTDRFPNLDEAWRTPDFLNLSLAVVQTLLEWPDLEASSERVVYCAVCEWIRHDAPGRRGHWNTLWPLIRFPLLSSAFIANVVEPDLSLRLFRAVLDEWPPQFDAAAPPSKEQYDKLLCTQREKREEERACWRWLTEALRYQAASIDVREHMADTESKRPGASLLEDRDRALDWVEHQGDTVFQQGPVLNLDRFVPRRRPDPRPDAKTVVAQHRFEHVRRDAKQDGSLSSLPFFIDGYWFTLHLRFDEHLAVEMRFSERHFGDRMRGWECWGSRTFLEATAEFGLVNRVTGDVLWTFVYPLWLHRDDDYPELVRKLRRPLPSLGTWRAALASDFVAADGSVDIQIRNFNIAANG